jgi:hypothetical protein
LAANFGDGFGLSRAIDRDPHDIGTGCSKRVHLAHRRVDIASLRRRHALDGDRLAGANGYLADANRSRWIAVNFHGSII